MEAKRIRILPEASCALTQASSPWMVAVQNGDPGRKEDAKEKRKKLRKLKYLRKEKLI